VPPPPPPPPATPQVLNQRALQRLADGRGRARRVVHAEHGRQLRLVKRLHGRRRVSALTPPLHCDAVRAGASGRGQGARWAWWRWRPATPPAAAQTWPRARVSAGSRPTKARPLERFAARQSAEALLCAPAMPKSITHHS